MIRASEEKILSFEKENLMDILHYLSRAVEGLTGVRTMRIYMEDLREGALLCLYTPDGELERLGARVPIQRRESFLVAAFLEGRVIPDTPAAPGGDALHQEWRRARGLERSTIVPLLHGGHALGVLSLDAPAGPSPILTSLQMEKVRDFIARVMPVLARAHGFHQQLMLSRHLDRARKKEAAGLFLKGALELDKALDMASVLIPTGAPLSEAFLRERGGSMEILTAASRDGADIPVYENMERISLLEGKSLLSQLVMQTEDRVVPRPEAPPHIFFEDMLSPETRGSLQRREVFQRIGLRSLLMVPAIDPAGSVSCVLNYFTKVPHRFSPEETALLVTHAQAVARALADVSAEHFEIRVLWEIEQMLPEEDLSVFLARVIAKTCELVGAETGSIGLVREAGGEKILVVEEEDGTLAGAKSRDWRKARIPVLRVGGEDLPPRERSLTGFVAHTGKPLLAADTRQEAARGGFYREISPDVRSELAVPILSGETVVGVINLDSTLPGYFTLGHQRILLLVSRLIGSRIHDLLKISELTREVARLKREVSYRDPAVTSYLLGNVIGKSQATRRMVDRIDRLVEPLANLLLKWDAEGDGTVELGLPTVLLLGESGSGKEFIFNNLYSLLNERYRQEGGRRRELSLRKTNIAAYSGELTYTELFGHRKGAYTGAASDRAGILEEANGGVAFLDEVGDADLKTQVQLLRFLDSGEFSRLGESQVRKSRVILVAATNRDLSELIARGAFREDLFHRLSEMVLSVPALRDRRDDIPDLARHFLGRLHATFGRGEEAPVLTPGALSLLTRLDFPGNFRQLIAVLQGALFEGTGSIGEEEIGRAVEGLKIQGRRDREAGEGAGELFGRISGGREDFWTGLYEPFTRHDLTRGQVLEVWREALERGGGVREGARLLGAFRGGGDEAKVLTRVKNFLYKTVGAGKNRPA